MFKIIAIFALGMVVGHFGPIYCVKWTAHSTATVLHTTGKALDTANKMIK